jgi:hypothetical protein|eukprot:g8694.t1
MEFVSLTPQEGGGSLPVAPQDSLYWVFLGLGFVSSLLALTTIISFIRVHYYTKDWTVQKLLQLVIFLCNTSRAIFFFGVHFNWEEVTAAEDQQNADSILNGRGFPTKYFIMNELPGVLFFSASTLLLLAWAKIYYTAQDNSKIVDQWFRPTCITANVCVYIMQGSLWLLYGLSNTFTSLRKAIEPLHVASSTTIAIVFLTTGIILVIFGNRTRDVLSSVPVDFRILKEKVQEIRLLGIVCTVCFGLRAAFIAYGTVANILGFKRNLPGVVPSVFLSCYYILLEILPCTIILYYYRRLPPPPPRTPAADFHQNYHTMNDGQTSPVTSGPSSGGGYNRTKSRFGFDQDGPGTNPNPINMGRHQ